MTTTAASPSRPPHDDLRRRHHLHHGGAKLAVDDPPDGFRDETKDDGSGGPPPPPRCDDAGGRHNWKDEVSNPAHDKILAARSRGLLRAMVERFSSTPLDPSSSSSRSGGGGGPAAASLAYSSQAGTAVPSPASRLTDSERRYLERLLDCGDPREMEAASAALEDAGVFFPDHPHRPQPGAGGGDIEGDPGDDEPRGGGGGAGSAAAAAAAAPSSSPSRRDSRLQQQLYRLHETADIHPSRVISRMSHLQESYLRSNSILQDEGGAGGGSLSLDDDLNSIVSSGNNCHHRGSSAPARGGGSAEQLLDDDSRCEEEGARDPFEDVAAWLVGQEGGGGGAAAAADTAPASGPPPDPYNSVPFKILGTSGSDASCHPHVLTPPLMDALFNFCPEPAALWGEEGAVPLTAANAAAPTPAAAPTATATTTANWWLKYSRARDGGGLAQLLRQARGSKHTVVAVETSTGHVLGSFTSSPWRLSHGWYGAGGGGGEGRGAAGGEPEPPAFVWKMRHPRCLQSPPQSSPSAGEGGGAPAASAARRSIVQQVCQESEIQVFPLRASEGAVAESDGAPDGGLVAGLPASAAVQSCSLAGGVRLGLSEVLPAAPTSSSSGGGAGAWEGEHYGHALAIDPSLRTGSTSTSETFGNPCLVRPDRRGEAFEIANLEVWTLTPLGTVADAEHAELERLFRSRP
jgi:hypothetical protein